MQQIVAFDDKLELERINAKNRFINEYKKELQQKEDSEIFRQKQAEQERIRKLPYFQFL